MLEQCFSECGPRLSASGFRKKNTLKLYQTLKEYISALKLSFLVDLQQKVGDLFLSVTSCPSIIISENSLNYSTETCDYDNFNHRNNVCHADLLLQYKPLSYQSMKQH
jgi:hypothetical protein